MDTRRQELQDLLPDRFRNSLESDDSDALDTQLQTLSDDERVLVGRFVDEVSKLDENDPTNLADDGAEIPEDSVSGDEHPLKEGRDELPPVFQLTGSQNIVPDPKTLAESTRSTGILYPVWWLTTRRPKRDDDLTYGFLGERDNKDRIHVGVARVYVPESHQFGTIGSKWWHRWFWSWADDRVKLRQVESRTGEAFWSEVDDVLKGFEEQEFEGLKSQALLFIHGYNVSFADAILRAAQIGCDLRVPGITVCFSWPSRGTYRGYPADAASVEASVNVLARTIAKLQQHVGTGRVHIVAHSMGNRAVLRALQLLVWESEKKLALGHITLAAPDVDRDVFRLLAPCCSNATRLQSNLYVSSKDRAVKLSRWLHDYPRAGFKPPITIARGIHTIDVSRIDMSWLGHGYYGDAAPVLEDISKVIHFNAGPMQRRLRETTEGRSRFWYID